MRARIKSFFLPLIYARRDLRAGLKGFYVFLACLVLGVAAIASIQSVSRGMVESLQNDGRYILGGDISLRTIYEPATTEQLKFLHNQIGPLTVIMETRAMARTPDDAQSTLVELKAVDLFYPLYGALEVTDMGGKRRLTALNDLQELLLPPPIIDGVEKDEWGALIEKELLGRLQIKIGDWIKVGEQRFQVRGVIHKEPDRIGAARYSIAPRVMISYRTIEKTGLRQLGSQVYYDHKVLAPYIKTFEDLTATKDKITAAFPDANWKGRDFTDAAPSVKRVIDQLTLFLTLIALTTLLVGGVGISNAVRSFLDSKLSHIATLKCLGGSQDFTFKVYMIQILMLATLGIILGLFLGMGAAKIAGGFLTEQLSLSSIGAVYPDALLLAAAFGYLTTLCFSLWPIGRAVKVSPTDLFRDLVSPSAARPSFKVVLWIMIVVQTLALLAILSASDQKLVIGFVIAAAATFAIFFGYAAIMKFVLKRIPIPKRPEIRMAVANLYRPGNVTNSVILSLGLGLTVLVLVALVQYNFTRLLKEDLAADAPSFFFLDIRPDQKDAFEAFVAKKPEARGLLMAPSFRGRIVKANGVEAEKALKDESEKWVISSDRGFTYATRLPAYSAITEGEWWPENYDGPPIVSIATDVAKAFDIGVGDTLTVNIFGMEIDAKVANVREINWGSFTMNFAVTFAPGLLARAPANYLATLIVTPEQEEVFQNEASKTFPNITIVRVGEALAQAQGIIRAVAQAVAICAGVTLIAGVLVLAGGIAAARRRHMYDAIVLKVLGATERRVLSTFLLEYAMLGVLTVIIAGGLGTLSAYGIQTFVMDMEWKFSFRALASVTLLCLFITLAAGFLGTWRALRQKPAPYLRNQ